MATLIEKEIEQKMMMTDKILCCVCLMVLMCFPVNNGYTQISWGIDTILCEGYQESFDSWYTDPLYQEDDVLFKPKDTSRQKAKIPNGWIVDSRYTIITGYSLFFYDTLRDADFGLYSPGALGTDSALYLRPTDYLSYYSYNNALTTYFRCSERYGGLSGYYKYQGDKDGDTLLFSISLCFTSPLFPREGCILGEKIFTDYPDDYEYFYIPLTFPDTFSFDAEYYFALSIAAYSNDKVQDTVSFFVIDELTFEHNTTTHVKSEERKWDLYPNPFTDQIRIRKPNRDERMSVTIYNLQGIPVSRYENLPPEERVIDTSSIPPGIYFIMVRDSDGKVAWKKGVKP